MNSLSTWLVECKDESLCLAARIEHLDTMATTHTDDQSAPTDPRVERTRLAVIDAGMAALVEQGPDGISHAAIAAAAGVSRTTLYKHWPTRAKLLLEILGAFDTHPPIPTCGAVRGDLVSLLDGMRASMSDATRRRIFSSMLAQAQWDDDVNEVEESLRAIPLCGLEEMLDAAVGRGEIIDGVTPMDAACRLIGPLMFSALIANADVMTVDIESIVDDWLATVRP